MHCSVDPPAIRCYSTTFLSATRRLLSSRDKLERAVQANSSPLGRFLSLSGHASSQPKLTEWTEERLRSLLDQGRRAPVRRNDLTMEFLENRDFSHYPWNLRMSNWSEYQKGREHRHYWGQALCCNYNWDWDQSRSLKRLFDRSKQTLIRLSEMQDDGRVKRCFKSSVPGVLAVEYTDEKGEIRYKTFHAKHSTDDVTARNHAPDDSTQLPSTPKEPVAGSSSSESRLEYKNVLEYREINRHARRKIEAWLNDGWSVEWVWNGLYDYKREDSRYEYNNPYRSKQWMTLKRSKANLSSSPSGKKTGLKFPKTPNPPPDPDPDPDYPAVYSDAESDCDSE